MIRTITLSVFLFIGGAVYSQGFPNAEKQPRLKESRNQNRRYAKQARRRHVRRGTAYIQFNNAPSLQMPVCVLTDDRISLGLVL